MGRILIDTWHSDEHAHSRLLDRYDGCIIPYFAHRRSCTFCTFTATYITILLSNSHLCLLADNEFAPTCHAASTDREHGVDELMMPANPRVESRHGHCDCLARPREDASSCLRSRMSRSSPLPPECLKIKLQSNRGGGRLLRAPTAGELLRASDQPSPAWNSNPVSGRDRNPAPSMRVPDAFPGHSAR